MLFVANKGFKKVTEEVPFEWSAKKLRIDNFRVARDSGVVSFCRSERRSMCLADLGAWGYPLESLAIKGEP